MGALALLVLGVVRARDGRDWIISELAIALLGIAFILLFFELKGGALVWDGAFVDDAFGRFMKGLALLGSLLTLILSLDYMRRHDIDLFEFPILVLIATLGMLMLISAQNLIALYLGLELMSLALYVLAAFNRDNVRAAEAGLKYFALGALSSGMLLYGCSLLYGFTGAISFRGIAAAIHGDAVDRVDLRPRVPHGRPRVQNVGRALPYVDAGRLRGRADARDDALCFGGEDGGRRGAGARRHDVLSRRHVAMAPDHHLHFAIMSMAVGSFAAIGQTNIKRLMAYSSIGHMGFALVGLAAGTTLGVQGVMIYLAIYLAMTIGTFAAVLSMRVGGRYVETIGDLAGLARTNGRWRCFSRR